GNDDYAENRNAYFQNGNEVTFLNALGGRNVSQMTCASVPADPLTGGTGTCSVSTVTQGGATPGRVAQFKSNLEFTSNFVAPSGTYTADAVAVDRSTGDVYVAGGNGDWTNPGGVIEGSDAPEFSVKRYSSAGTELDQIGANLLTADTFQATSNG